MSMSATPWTWRPLSSAAAARVAAALRPVPSVAPKPADPTPQPTRKAPKMNKPSRIRRFRRWMRSAAGQKATHLAPVVAVALVALYVSYWHIRGGALRHGYDIVSASILPVSVDCLVLVAARYISRARTTIGRWCAVAAFVLGVAATVAGNILASRPDLISRGFSLWPAIAVVATGAVLHWGEARPRRKRVVAAAKTPRRTTKATVK